MIPAMAPSSWAADLLGLNPMILAASILALVYGCIITEKVNRTISALLGAGLVIMLGLLNQHEAFAAIDLNTIFLLIGMMILVAITRRSGLFACVALWAARAVSGNPRALLAVMAVITACFSALLDNVTTVLLVIPVTFLVCDQLKLNAYPFLFTQIFASNIGGTATLIGDPPNIMIGSAAHLSFAEFILNVGPAACFALIVVLIVADVIWGRRFNVSASDMRAMVATFKPADAITDKPLLIKSLCVLALVITGFVLGHPYGLEPGTIALTGAALLKFLDSLGHDTHTQNARVQETLSQVEWETVFFFIGLFIVVKAVEQTGLLHIAARSILQSTGGDLAVTAFVVLWASAIMSAIIDNIPFVATMIPMIHAMAPEFGGASGVQPLWWALSLGACLGGNGTLIGASANVTVAGLAARHGLHMGFVRYLKLAFPLMILTIMIAHVWIGLRWFW